MYRYLTGLQAWSGDYFVVPHQPAASIPAKHVSNSSGSGYYLIGVFMLGGMSSDEDYHARGGRSFPHATVKRGQRHAFLSG
jgi:hypothetical protein